MKRAWYAAGVVALAPLSLALGGTTPANAQSHTSAPGEKVTKTVSLRHSAAASGCTGSVEFHSSYQGGEVRLHGWKTSYAGGREYCIGTVVVSLYFTATNFCKSVHLSIYDNNGLENRAYAATQRVCDTTPGWRTADFGIHTYIPRPLEVVANSTYGGYAGYEIT